MYTPARVYVFTYVRMGRRWNRGEGGNRQLVSQAEKLPLNVSLLASFSLVPKCRSYWRQTIEASSASIMSAPFMYLFLSNCVYRNAFLSFFLFIFGLEKNKNCFNLFMGDM